MDVSIIIVNYHSADMVIDCINSVWEKTKSASVEIIVVDNASGDGSADTLRRAFGDRITLIESPENLGFGRANNLGAKQAAGEYLFLLNPDTILVNDAIDVLKGYLDDHPACGVAGGNLFFPDLSPAPSFCRRFDDLQLEKQRASWTALVGGKIREKLLRGGKAKPLAEFNHTDTPEKVAYIFGADMMLKRSLYEAVGGFDPDFFMYGEEQELTWRITARGYEVVCVSQARIIHLEGATSKARDAFSERQFRMRMNGTLTYYKKRFGDAGAAEFFRLRSRRYERLMKIAQVQGKLTDDFGPAVMKRLLALEYQAFTEK